MTIICKRLSSIDIYPNFCSEKTQKMKLYGNSYLRILTSTNNSFVLNTTFTMEADEHRHTLSISLRALK